MNTQSAAVLLLRSEAVVVGCVFVCARGKVGSFFGVERAKMYEEIQEAVNFIARFFYGKIPRRKVYLFAEQLANFLALKYQDHWSVDEPQKESLLRAVYVNVHGVSEPLLAVAAMHIGLELDEIMQFLSSELTIWINPGSVCYRVGDHGPTQTLFDASLPHNGIKLNVPHGPAGDSNVNLLKLNLNTPESSNWVVANAPGGAMWPVFELSSPHDVMFTVGSFAVTRFGTSKQKTNLAVLKDIRRKAAFNAVTGSSSNCNMFDGISASPSQTQLHQQVLQGEFPRMSHRGPIF